MSVGRRGPVHRDRRERQRPAVVAQYVQNLGPTFLSVAHYLALRPDLVGLQNAVQLSGVGEAAPPLGWSAVRETLERGTGQSVTRTFSFVSPAPVASTAIAQWHRARLLGGAEVIVKLVRPDARRAVEQDLARAGIVRRLLVQTGGPALAGRHQEVVEDLRAWFDAHLDLSHELANMSRLRDMTDERSVVSVPRSYAQLSSPEVLVTQDLGGVPLADLLSATGSDLGDDAGDALRLHPHRAAANVAIATLQQLFRLRFFCADVHPRNLLVLPGDLVCFADHGYCASLDAALSERLLAYVSAVFDEDVERMLEPPIDREALLAAHPGFRKELLRSIRDRATGDATFTGRPDEVASGAAEFLTVLTRAAAIQGVPLLETSPLVYRTMAAAQTVAQRLEADAPVARVSRRYLRFLRVQDALHKVGPDGLQPTMVSLLHLIHDLPIQVERLLGDLSDGNFSLNVHLSESSRIASDREHHTRVLVMAICTVGVALLLTVPALPRPAGVSLAWPLGMLLAGMYAWLLIAIRRRR